MRERQPTLVAAENQLARLLRNVSDSLTMPGVRALHEGGSNVSRTQEQLYLQARRWLDTLGKRPDALLPRRAQLVRELAFILRNLELSGALDMHQAMITELIDTRPSLAASMPDPINVVRTEALVYERSADVLMHRHMQAVAGAVSDAVLTGLEAQETNAEIGARLYVMLKGQPNVVDGKKGLLRSWANTWAITEANRYNNLGRIEMAEEAGDYVWGYRYQGTLDDHTCDECAAYIDPPLEVSKEDCTDFTPFHFGCRTNMWPVMSSEITGRENRSDTDALAEAGKGISEGFGGDPREALREAA